LKRARGDSEPKEGGKGVETKPLSQKDSQKKDLVVWGESGEQKMPRGLLWHKVPELEREREARQREKCVFVQALRKEGRRRSAAKRDGRAGGGEPKLLPRPKTEPCQFGIFFSVEGLFERR
jgi:hypothetical protein